MSARGPRPLGYSLLALYLCAGVLGNVEVLTRPGGISGPGELVLRALALLRLGLGAVAIEALVRLRPWCASAVRWLAAAVALSTAASHVIEGRYDMLSAIGDTLLLIVLLVIVQYVESRAGRLFPGPVPRPQP